jgi:hypothetical protein
MSHTVVGGTHYRTRWVTRGDVDGGGLRESSWWYTTGGVHPPSHRPSPRGAIDSLSITSAHPNDYQLA